MNNYDYYYSTPAPDAGNAVAGAAFMGLFVFFMLLIVAASYAIGAFLLGRIFKKAGVPQWAAWVPVYNVWTLLELGDQFGFWAILAFIPFVNLIAAIFIILSTYKIGLKLGKSGWFVLLAIFIPIVWLIWLGFDDSKWPEAKKSAAKPVAKTTRKPAKKSAPKKA